MQNVMKALSHFWAVFGPWITVSLIPTIITGLSLSPKTAPEAAALQKAWDAVKKFLSFFSVATHKDEPGTFKPPLNLGSLIKKKMPPAGPAGGCAAALLLIVFSMHTSACNAQWWKSTGTAVGHAAADCTKSSIQAELPNLIPTVLTILAKPADWEKQLLALTKQFGQDELACAVKDAMGAAQGALGGPQSQPVENSNTVVSRGHEYLSKNKITFAGSQ